MAIGEGDTDPGNRGGSGPVFGGAGERNVLLGPRSMGSTLPPRLPGESNDDYWARMGSGSSSGFWDSFLKGTGGIDPGMFDKFNLNFDPYTSWLQKQGAIPVDP